MKVRVNKITVDDVKDEDLAKMCLHINGGGWSVDSTADALLMQRDLMSGQVVTTPSGNEIQVILDEEEPCNG